MTAFDDWFQRKTAARSVGIREAREVSFVHQRALGPRSQFAGVTMQFQPAMAFVFRSTVTWPEGERADDYVGSVMDGVLDELLAGDVRPFVTRLQVDLQNIQWHPVDSSPRAFYFAARGAVRQALGLDGGTPNILWQLAQDNPPLLTFASSVKVRM